MSTQPNDSVSKPSSNTSQSPDSSVFARGSNVAGVSLLALAQPAAGEVAVTRKTIQIPVITSDMPHPVRISMANNGVDNFSFSLISFPANGNTYPVRDLILYGASSNANPVFGCCSLHAYASPLQRGANIGPSSGSVGFLDLMRNLSAPTLGKLSEVRGGIGAAI